jgi:protein-arginine deiminase
VSARSAVALAVSVAFVVAAPIRPAFAAPTADLRADVNRDGVLTRADDAAEERWTNRRGAIVLPNLDDDQSRCPKLRPDGLPLADDVLPTCHDAADTVVNGQTDLADLARLRVEPIAGLPDSAHVTVKAGPRARLYVRRGDGWAALPATGELTAAEARHGVDLAIEATDIVRDLAVWNGMVDVMVNLVMRTTATSDRVRLRVAPLLIQHDLMTVQRMMVADRRTDPLAKGTEVRRDILGRPMATPRSTDPLTEEEEFRRDLRAGLDSAGLTKPFIEHPVGGFEGDI